ncbi:MAG: sulfotransferase domain-containing protein, partial [Chloroflexota bacterium]
AFVSSYHFLEALFLGQTIPSVETWLDLFLSKYSAQGIWHEFVASWWALRHEPNVLFMTYESMKADAGQAIEKVAEVMGVELTAVQLTNIQHLSSFAHMKSIEEKFYPPIVSPLYQPGGTMIRKGQTGTASELLSPAQQQRIDDYCRAGLQALGSDFPYDEWYG